MSEKPEGKETMSEETASTQPDSIVELQEKYQLLAKEGMQPVEILRRILQEDINADIKTLSRLSGLGPMEIGRIKGPISRHLKTIEKASPPSSDTEGLGTSKILEKPESVYRTETDVNKILRQVISSHPDINAAQVSEIMSWAEMTPGGLHPTSLYTLLLSFKGIDQRIANVLSQKYSLAVSKANQDAAMTGQMPGIAPGSWPQQQGSQMPMFNFPQTFPQQGAYGNVPQTIPSGLFTRDQVQRMLDDQKKENQMERLTDKITNLEKDLPRLIRENTPDTQGPDMEVVEIPIDAEGNPCQPNQAVSVRRMTRPIKTDSEMTFLDKLAKYKDAGIIGKNLDVEDIRKIIKEEQPLKDDPQLKRLEDMLEATKKELKETKDQITAADRQRLEDKVTGLENRLEEYKSALRSSGVNSPEGVIATGITELGKRNPVKDIINGVKDVFISTPSAASAQPTDTTRSKEHRTSILQALKDRNLVTTVRERIRG